MSYLRVREARLLFAKRIAEKKRKQNYTNEQRRHIDNDIINHVTDSGDTCENQEDDE